MLVFAEVVYVERAEPPAGTDLVPIDVPFAPQHDLAEGVVGHQRLGPKQPQILPPVQRQRVQHREIAPAVGNLRAAGALAILHQIEHAAGAAVGMIEFQVCLVEPNLHHARLKGDFEAASGQDRAIVLSTSPPSCERAGRRRIGLRLNAHHSAAVGAMPVMPKAIISDNAEMVAVGLAPTALGTIEPSAT